MRRTLALAGAAVLGVTGLAGPASADPGAGITVLEGVVFHEVSAELDPGSTDPAISGGYIELVNTAGGNVSIANWEVIACNTTDDFSLTIPADAAAVLAPGETYLIADTNYASLLADPPNVQFPNSVEFLEQAAGGVQLENDGAGSEVQDEIMWGDDPHATCADFLPDIGTTPTDALSANRESPLPWSLQTPSPERSN